MNVVENFVHQPLHTGEWIVLIILVSIVGKSIVSLVETVASYVRKTRLDDMEATLKMEMIERGMSAEEIKTVLAAKTESALPESWEKWIDAMSAHKRAWGCKHVKKPA